MPTVAYGSIGTGGAGTNSASPTFPAVSAGNLLVCFVANKYPNNDPDLPTDAFGGIWVAPSNNQGTGGAGAAGPDSGDVYSTVFVKEATGTETGTLSISVPSGDSTIANIAVFTKSGGIWSYAACNGGDTTSGTDYSVTGNVDPGVQADDMVVQGTAINSIAATTGSAHAITQSGVTYDAAVEIYDNGTSFGDNVGGKISYHPVSAGLSAGVPTYTMTLAVAAAGGTVMLRIRAIDDATPITGLGRRHMGFIYARPYR